MARLDVDELVAGRRRQPRRGDEILHQPIQVVVGQHRHAGRHTPIEHGVRAPPRAAPADRTRSAATSGRSASAAARERRRRRRWLPNFSRCAAISVSRRPAIAWLVRLGQQQLVRIGAAVVPHRDRFPTPDQLGAAQAEVAPAADGELRRPPVGRAVPAFHRQHAEPVADANAVQLERPRQRRLAPAAAGRRRSRAGCSNAAGAP